jgi:hypothetical protein
MRCRIVVVSAVLLAACGGGSTVKAASGGGASTSAVSSASSKAASAVSATAGSDVSSTTAPKFSGNGSDDFCSWVRKQEKSQKLDDLFTGDSPEQLKTDFLKARDFVAEAKKRAPGEIKEDVTTVLDAFEKLVGVLGKYNFSIQAAIEAAAADPVTKAVFDEMDTEKFSGASDRVDAYMTNVCGVSP